LHGSLGEVPGVLCGDHFFVLPEPGGTQFEASVHQDPAHWFGQHVEFIKQRLKVLQEHQDIIFQKYDGFLFCDALSTRFPPGPMVSLPAGHW
jgi:hypothetical protein